MTMKNFFLLIVRISGIKNIEKEIEIPFYKKTIKNDFDPEKYRIKGIYGENGSGKTAVMTAVRIMTRVILDRNYLSDSVNQQLLVENINKKTRKSTLETEFYAQMDIGPFIYRYRIEFEIRKDERVYITKEALERKIGHNSQNSYRPVYKVKDGNLLQYSKDETYEYCRRKTQNLLEQRSFATFVNEIRESGYGDASLNWYHLFTLACFAASIIVVTDLEDDHRNDAYRKIRQNKETDILREGEDLTIFSRASTAGLDKKEVMVPRSQLRYYMDSVNRLQSFIQIFKTDLEHIKVDVKEYGEYYICRRIMVYDGYELDEEYESRGIRKLMDLYEALDAASRGDIVFIDELDSNINDIYLDKLIEYLMFYGKGQLCFTAHNLSPMSVLRDGKCAISFLSGINTVHTWMSNGNQTPEHAYRDGFIEDSPFNVDASDFLGILGGTDE